ncbi:hypothetical protein A2U01_0110635, partial [Trifolium medium]|nr:hypothetical protein [Trifolium medium]
MGKEGSPVRGSKKSVKPSLDVVIPMLPIMPSKNVSLIPK